jgi:hypothetical protein
LNTGVTTGAINVTGASWLQGGVTAGSVNVTGASWLQGGVTAGSVNVSGASWLLGGATAGSTLLSSTTDATGLGTGGSLTVLGGAAISKTLYVGNSLYSNSRNITPSLGDIWSEISFAAANNVSSESDVTGLVFANATVRAFHVMLSVTIERSAGGNLYTNFDLKGIQKGSSWVVNTSYIGDYSGIVFSITNAGQIQYTSTNQLSWTATTMKFRGHTTTV